MTLFGGIPYIPAFIATFLMSLFGFFNLTLFAWLARVIQKQRPIPPFLLLPPLYLATEWLVPKLFPWYLGAFLYGWRAGRQIADITGVLGLSLIILIANVTIYLWFVSLKQGSKKPITETVITILIIISTQIYGLHRINELEDLLKNRRNLRISLVQTNIGSLQKEQAARGAVGAVAFAHQRNEELVLLAGKENPDLIVLPETAVHGTFTQSKIIQYRMFALARDVNASIFFGGYHSETIDGVEVDYNTAFLISPNSELVGHYNKIELLLFGEYLPFPDLFIWPENVKEAVGEFKRGEEIKVLPFKTEKIAPLICYEGILPRLVRKFVLEGATVFVNISNDSWFGDSAAPRQHMMLAAWRTVEHRVPLVRSTNTGISGFINIFGDISDRIELNQIGVSTKEIDLIDTKTFYTKYGDWLAKLSIILSIIFLSLGVLKIIRRKKIQSSP
ncbi:MAG: apolipoprotein N-acyltransferase [Deltaproteobacteria bacterium RIFCSPHIGHO2_12_FULL_43_9]|nr:MAG: apolipoprotein N-acyltransferase [Deltaproteobacteria bacterium RIFCSPHIGHO2_12_FULL_43_9]